MRDFNDRSDLEVSGLGPRDVGIPVKDVRIVGSVSSTTGAINSHHPNSITVEIPDVDELKNMVQNQKTISDAVSSDRGQNYDIQKDVIEKKMWEATRDAAIGIDDRSYDASDHDDILYAIEGGVHECRRMGVDTESLNMHMNNRTRKCVSDNLFDMEQSNFRSGDNLLNILGQSFKIEESEYLETGEVMIGDASRIEKKGPTQKDYMLIEGIPVGIDVQIKVRGWNNQIEVERYE